MSNPDKRRGGGHGPGGPSSSHLLRTTPSSNRNSIIAPPPRAALGGGGVSSATSSPPPADDGPKDPPGNSNSNSSNTGASSSSTNPSSSTSSTPASAAATAQLLKDKDARIASLTRELALMETEFTRELDKLSASESETAAFWQAKHSGLHQQFLRADTELRLLRAEVELREAERDELRAGWEGARREAGAAGEEARSLRAQVRGLKEWVSTSTRTGGAAATSDEVVGEKVARLGNGLQNWVIVNFRRAKLDISKASKPVREELARLVPMYEDLVHTAKVHLLQSVVSRLLVELVFDAYFIGLSPEQARQFAQMEASLSSFAGTAEPVNLWRSQTLSILNKEAASRLQAETSRVTDEVIARVNRIMDAITDARSTDARNQALRALVSSSVELSRTLVVQKAVFKVAMPEILPHHKVLFDGATMEDIGGEDEESLTHREICCVTFPGIIKRGDETGGHLQYTNLISKARVLCSPE